MAYALIVVSNVAILVDLTKVYVKIMVALVHIHHIQVALVMLAECRVLTCR